MTKLSTQHERWLAKSSKPAELLITAGVGYHDALTQLTTFYVRLLVGRCKEDHNNPHQQAAKLAGLSMKSVSRAMGSKPVKLSREAMIAASSWAAYLVREKATYREAVFIFRRSLLKTAVRLHDNNHVAAARVLRVHRNTIWNIPESLSDVHFRLARRKAAAA